MVHNLVAASYFGEVGGIAAGSTSLLGSTITAVTVSGGYYANITLSVPARASSSLATR